MKGMIGRGIQPVVRGRTIAFACAGALFAAGSSAAFAQGLAAVPNTMAPIYMNNTIGLVGISGARQAAEAAYGRRSSSPPIVQPQRLPNRNQPPPIVRNAPPPTWNYSIATDRGTSDLARSEYFRRLRPQMSATAAKNMEAVYARKPLRQSFLEIARPLGLSDRDLRDVMTAYLVTGWMVANEAPSPSASQISGVRKEVDGIFKGMSPVTDAGQRQIIGEVIMYGIVGQNYARNEIVASGNKDDLAKFTRKMAGRYKEDGYDFQNLAIDNGGFRKRK